MILVYIFTHIATLRSQVASSSGGKWGYMNITGDVNRLAAQCYFNNRASYTHKILNNIYMVCLLTENDKYVFHKHVPRCCDVGAQIMLNHKDKSPNTEVQIYLLSFYFINVSYSPNKGSDNAHKIHIQESNDTYCRLCQTLTYPGSLTRQRTDDILLSGTLRVAWSLTQCEFLSFEWRLTSVTASWDTNIGRSEHFISCSLDLLIQTFSAVLISSTVRPIYVLVVVISSTVSPDNVLVVLIYCLVRLDIKIYRLINDRQTNIHYPCRPLWQKCVIRLFCEK